MDEVELPPNVDAIPPPGMGLVEELDKLLMIQLRDGRKLIGVMRSFDQFANIVLEGTRVATIPTSTIYRLRFHRCLAAVSGGNASALVSRGSNCIICRVGAKERIIVGDQYADVPLGLHLVRGENVVLLGEVDELNDPPKALQPVSEAQIKQALKAEQEADKMKGMLRTRFDFLDDLG